MKSLICLFWIGLVYFPLSSGGWFYSSPLFQKNFNVYKFNGTLDYRKKVLDDQSHVWLIDYYAPWCPHCQHFAPEWEGVADYFAESSLVSVGVVDCTLYGDICSNEKVYAYPGIKMFHVPLSSKEPLVNIGGGAKKTKQLIDWVELNLKENNMTSGIDRASNVSTKKELVSTKKEHVQVEKGGALKANRVIEQKGGSVIEQKGPVVVGSIFDGNGELLLLDAGNALSFSLLHGIMMGTSVLKGEQLNLALTWLEILISNFPLSRNQQCLQLLLNQARQKNSWTREEWGALLQRWKQETSEMTYPKNLFTNTEYYLCSTYTCGLWTLFHFLTVNAELEKSVPPYLLAKGIRDFVANFFGCEDCVKHFLQANPPSVIERIYHANDSVKELNMWLVRMHNSVNLRLKHPLWPPKAQCASCYKMDTSHSFDEEVVYHFFRKTYLLPDNLVKTNQAVPTFQNKSFFSIHWFILAGFFLIIMYFYKCQACWEFGKGNRRPNMYSSLHVA